MQPRYDVPENYNELVAGGDASYEIIGVVAQSNIDAMRMFLEAVGIVAEQIEVDDGTQVIITHPDETKVITVDAGGLGDCDRHGFDVTIAERSEVLGDNAA